MRGALAQDVSGFLGERHGSDEYWAERHEEWMRLNQIPPANSYDPGPSEQTLEDTDWVTIGAGDKQLYTSTACHAWSWTGALRGAMR